MGKAIYDKGRYHGCNKILCCPGAVSYTHLLKLNFIRHNDFYLIIPFSDYFSGFQSSCREKKKK